MTLNSPSATWIPLPDGSARSSWSREASARVISAGSDEFEPERRQFVLGRGEEFDGVLTHPPCPRHGVSQGKPACMVYRIRPSGPIPAWRAAKWARTPMAGNALPALRRQPRLASAMIAAAVGSRAPTSAPLGLRISHGRRSPGQHLGLVFRQHDFAAWNTSSLPTIYHAAAGDASPMRSRQQVVHRDRTRSLPADVTGTAVVPGRRSRTGAVRRVTSRLGAWCTPLPGGRRDSRSSTRGCRRRRTR